MEPKKNIVNFPPQANLWVPIDELHITAVAAALLPPSAGSDIAGDGMVSAALVLAHLLLFKVDDCQQCGCNVAALFICPLLA